MKEKISEFVYSHREEMVDIIRQLVEIPSVKGKPEQSAPFGAEPRRALDKMLEICREHGFVTVKLQQLLESGIQYDEVLAIGPIPMMKFVSKTTEPFGVKTVVSLNPIMVDGTGMCGACRLHVGDEIKFACVDGPEFDGHLVNFDEAMKRQQMYKTQEGRAMLKLQEGDTHHGGCGNCGGDK